MSTSEDELDKLESAIEEQREKWNKIVQELSNRINDDLKKSMELSATAVAYRQKIISEIGSYAVKSHRLMSKLKVLKKHYFEEYATKYQIKTNTTEKNMCIDADTSTFVAKIDLIDSHVQFLVDCGKNIDNVIWSVKNKIQLYNITGLD